MTQTMAAPAIPTISSPTISSPYAVNIPPAIVSISASDIQGSTGAPKWRKNLGNHCRIKLPRNGPITTTPLTIEELFTARDCMTTGALVVEAPAATIESVSPKVIVSEAVAVAFPGPVGAAPSYETVPNPVNDFPDVLSIPVAVIPGRNWPEIVESGPSVMVSEIESPPQAVVPEHPAKFRTPTYVPAQAEIGVDAAAEGAGDAPPQPRIPEAQKSRKAEIFMRTEDYHTGEQNALF